MIKDVMVRLDGTPEDDVRLAAVGQIAEIFDSHITGLLFNALPPLVPDGSNGAGANEVTRLLDAARQAGDDIEATVFQRLAKLPYPANLLLPICAGSMWSMTAMFSIPHCRWRAPPTPS
jgi:hypothetical protein